MDKDFRKIILVSLILTLIFIVFVFLFISTEKIKNKEKYSDFNNFQEESEYNKKLNLKPGEVINLLFDKRKEFEYETYFYPENLTVIWKIKSKKENIDLIEYHVKQMDTLLKSGHVPRRFDPLFRFEASLKPYIETKIIRISENELKIIKKAKNRCAYYAIEIHAKVIRNFFKIGREEAMKTHPLPKYVVEECKEFIR